jgi:hypothetical protein
MYKIMTTKITMSDAATDKKNSNERQKTGECPFETSS